MMNGLWCLLYPCDGVEHAVFILADLRVELKWFGTTLEQLDSFGNAEVVIHLLTRAAVKFTKERLILGAESHKLDSEIEPRLEGPSGGETFGLQRNEAPLQASKALTQNTCLR